MGTILFIAFLAGIAVGAFVLDLLPNRRRG
jgi:hypothetical protein